jgi:glucan biosynthesis protein C
MACVSQSRGAADRRNDLDWVRVLATIAVLFFHCGRFLDDEGWHVKNRETSVGISVLVQFIVIWLMPVFFVVSGQSVHYLLRSASNAKFLVTRVTRLLVPFVFGVLVLIPPQVWAERTSHGQWSGAFLGFLPRYFDGWYGFGGNFAWMGLHLWYLGVLLIFSFAALPLFRFLERRPVAGPSGRGFGEHPAAALLLGLALVAAELLVDLRPGGIGRRDFGGWSLGVYVSPASPSRCSSPACSRSSPTSRRRGRWWTATGTGFAGCSGRPPAGPSWSRSWALAGPT